MWMQREDLENVFLKGEQYSIATALDWLSECFISSVRHGGCCALALSAKVQCRTPPHGSAFALALGSEPLAAF